MVWAAQEREELFKPRECEEKGLEKPSPSEAEHIFFPFEPRGQNVKMRI